MKLTGGEIIAEYLISQGVEYIAGIPGHGCLGLVDAFVDRKDKLKIIMVKQEMSAAHLADGYYRASGKPLAVFTSIGPGAINTAIGAATAFVDSTPMIIFSGSPHVHMRGKGLLQEFERQRDDDFDSIFKPFVKRTFRADSVGQLPSILKRAFSVMMTGRRGPVNIVLPMDVQCASIDVKLPVQEKAQPSGRVKGDPEMIVRAAELFASAKRPVILAGGGIAASRAHKQLLALAELKGAAVVTTMQGKGVFPEDHPLYAWHTGSKGTSVGLKMTSTADVILAVGCRFADETCCSYRNGVAFKTPDTKFIHIDIDPYEIGKNYPVEVGIVGDAASALEDIADEMKKIAEKQPIIDKAYLKEIAAENKVWAKHVKKLASVKTKYPTITQVFREMREAVARDAFVVTSSGNTQAQMLQEFPFYEPGTCITTGGFSTMGFTLPAALGVKLANPDRQVIGIVGDGDFMMTMQEMTVAMELNIPILMIVVNNQCWMAIKDLQSDALGTDRTISVDFTTPDGKPYSPDFAAVAKAFGLFAQKVDTIPEIGPAIKKALDSGKPSFLEITIHRDYPYSGSPAVGWWDVPIPTYLKQRRALYEKGLKEEKL